MTLGLYGDSFVCSGNLHAWTHVLKNSHGYDITNHGWPGTGIDYSYHKFITTHHKFEKVLFVAANIHRGTIFEPLNGHMRSLDENIDRLKVRGLYGLPEGYTWMSDALTGGPMSELDKKYVKIKSLERRHYGFSNELLKYNAMVSHVKLLRPDVKFVYAFDRFDSKVFWNIPQIDMKKFKTENESLLKRPCHMSEEQNIQVAHYMDMWLKDELDFNITLDPNVLETYYTASENLEQAGLTL
jgi:hypothetical protein